jgi:glycosyltransferase involved in cell wall biosynthesis
MDGQRAPTIGLLFGSQNIVKVAIVHYWLVGMRGGEKVVESLCKMYPDADIFTLVASPANLSDTIRSHKITTSFLQKIGGVKHYRKMLPLMPFALEGFDLTAYDLVISSEAGPAKAVITRPDALHVCYCHSPMRYLWDLEPQYRKSAGRVARMVMSVTHPFLRQWDVTSSARVDQFVANSEYVAGRIRKFFRRDAIVVNPPVDLDQFKPSAQIGEAYLCAGQITPYKKIEIAVEAFTRMGKRLDVAGDGASDRLKAMAGPSVQFLGPLSNEDLRQKLANTRALIYPGLEDFGMVPVETIASGRPVIAFGKGGAVETVVDGVTGVLFHEQTPEALVDAVARFEKIETTLDYRSFPEKVAKFSLQSFESKMSRAIASAWADQSLAQRRVTEQNKE